MSKEIVKDGSSTAVYLGVPSFEIAYAEALQKALDEFQIPNHAAGHVGWNEMMIRDRGSSGADQDQKEGG